MYHSNITVNLIPENVIQIKSGITIRVSVKIQENIMFF